MGQLSFSGMVLLLLFTFEGFSQKLDYIFKAPNARHHEAIITLTASQLPEGPAMFRMSRSSPGRYATHEFGKNIYQLKAVDGQGNPLAIVRREADVYEVSGHKGTVTVEYTLYANHADGTYASVDVTGFHLNIPATFLWVKGLEEAPITVKFNLPDTLWTVATQLYSGKEKNTFTAPNLQYFMDSPVKAGPLRYRRWNVTNSDGLTQEMSIAFDTEADDEKLDAFAVSITRIAAEAAAVFGEYPRFEDNRYIFLASLNPWVQGDGMEHRNSTMISVPINPEQIRYATGVFSHEFFHAWNVERIRPRTLEPFNFERSNVSDGLWVSEGFTQYYGNLIELRAGITEPRNFTGGLAAAINTKVNRPGGQLYNVIQNSQNAVFADAGAAIDKNNFQNNYSSYYVTGAAMALAMDLELRLKFNSSLDEFMKKLWLMHGKPEKPFTIPDLRHVLASTTGDDKFAAGFFEKYIDKNQPYDYATALKSFGILVKKREEGRAWLGQQIMEEKNSKLVIRSNSAINTTLYDAGMDIGDELAAIDGTSIRTAAELGAFLSRHKPGDEVTITFLHRGKEEKAMATLRENPDVIITLDEAAPESARALREKWFAPASR